MSVPVPSLRARARAAALRTSFLGLIAVGVIVTIAGFDVMGGAGTDLLTGGRSPAVLSVLRIVLGSAMVGAGAGLAGFGARRRQRTAEELLARDDRPPVLYLRSFSKDSDLDRTVNSQLVRSVTLEERLSLELAAFGPVVALDEPGADLVRLGASRLSATEASWKAEVVALAARASLVVFMAGASPGLAWEMAHVTSAVHPSRVVAIVRQPGPEYDAFAATWHAATGLRLPEVPRGSWTDRRYSFRGIVTFGSQWESEFHETLDLAKRNGLRRALARAGRGSAP